MATLNLTKAEKIDLTKGTDLRTIAFAAGWDVGDNFDLDIFAIGVDANGAYMPGKVSFFGNKTGLNGCTLDGDNLTGEGDGDDETITIDLPAIDPTVDQIIFGINIYQASQRGQNFGKVKNAFVRVYNKQNNEEVCKFDLSEDFGRATGVITAKMYRHNGEWKIQALGLGTDGDINDIANICMAELAEAGF